MGIPKTRLLILLAGLVIAMLVAFDFWMMR